ncbi:MAG: TMEM165/GDT1 family protein [Candidatus Aenigmarchaeota archaeon]|nr:TMEM165/GDT1 family protein [Candidatus Aenigmarchaeota archaeon]
MGYEILPIAFAIIFISEIADKTQLVVIGLSAKYQQRLQVYAGAVAALVFSDGIAVIAGSLLYSLVSPVLVKLLAGGLFIVIGFYSFMQEERKEHEVHVTRIILTVFAVVFFSELGDKSQIASGALGAGFGDLPLVFAGIALALAAITLLSILIGSRIAQWKHRDKMGKVSAIIFIAVGIITLLT